MFDVPEPIFDDPATPAAPRGESARRPAGPPLRSWSMWGGWGALGVVCAAGLAHAVSVVGRTVSRPA